jgi:hypothetical protein
MAVELVKEPELTLLKNTLALNKKNTEKNIKNKNFKNYA